MNVVESFSSSKTGDEQKNEDTISITPDFAAIFDGSTLGAGDRLVLPSGEKATGGRFVAITLTHALKQLPANSTAKAAIPLLSDFVKAALEVAAPKAGVDLSKSFAAATLLIYSKHQNEIWRVGDAPFMLDAKARYFTPPISETRSRLRQLYLEMELLKGATIPDLLANDPTLKKLPPLFEGGNIFANTDAVRNGYAIINGSPVPNKFIHVFSAAKAREIVLASDGYPKLFRTLERSEDYLQQQLKEDPLCFRTNLQSKGLAAGNISYDDRSYLRLRL